MQKMKLLTVVLFCLGFAGLAAADQVININLGDANDLTDGQGNVWRGFLDGYGLAMGSAETADLANYDEPNQASIYAAQVWIGVLDTMTVVPDTEVTDSGFTSSDDTPIYLIGTPKDANLNPGVYGGEFAEVIIYGSQGTSVTLDGGTPEVVPVGGYVTFEDVVVDANNTVEITWDGFISAMQLVRSVPVLTIDKDDQFGPNNEDGTELDVTNWSVASELNGRGADEMTPFGPDMGELGDDYYDPNDVLGGYGIIQVPIDYNTAVMYLQVGEWMDYEITVDADNAGLYDITACFSPGYNGASGEVEIQIYGANLGNLTVSDMNSLALMTYTSLGENVPFCYMPGFPAGIGGDQEWTNPTVSVYLLEGTYTVRWKVTNPIYFNVVSLIFEYIADLSGFDCEEATRYGWGMESDYTGDCAVDAADLALIADGWVECYDPNTDNCP